MINIYHQAWPEEMPEHLQDADEQLTVALGSLATINVARTSPEQRKYVGGMAMLGDRAAVADAEGVSMYTVAQSLGKVYRTIRRANQECPLFIGDAGSAAYAAYDNQWINSDTDPLWGSILTPEQALMLKTLPLGLTAQRARKVIPMPVRTHAYFDLKDELQWVLDAEGESDAVLVRRGYETGLFVPRLPSSVGPDSLQVLSERARQKQLEARPKLDEALDKFYMHDRVRPSEGQLIALHAACYKIAAPGTKLSDSGGIVAAKQRLGRLGQKIEDVQLKRGNELYRTCLSSSAYTAYLNGWLPVRKDKAWAGELTAEQQLVLDSMAVGLRQVDMIELLGISRARVIAICKELHNIFGTGNLGLGAIIRRSFEVGVYKPKSKRGQRK